MSHSRRRIALTGAGGMIGGALRRFFLDQGDEVIRLQRSPAKLFSDAEVFWDPYGEWDPDPRLEGLDAVIHLAGANIAARRWTPAYKKEILASRVEGTRSLVRALGRLEKKPRFFVCASAVGYYGSDPAGREDQLPPRDETSPPGKGFLADVCRAWEAEARRAEDEGMPTIRLRLGAVLAREGGPLGKMLPIFRLGLGGVVGSGRQVMSWVALTDIPKIINFLFSRKPFSGAVNVTAPNAVTNREFTQALADALHRPAVLPLPSTVVRAIFGEMGQALLLEGCRVVPRWLEEAGYSFEAADIVSALNLLLSKK